MSSRSRLGVSRRGDATLPIRCAGFNTGNGVDSGLGSAVAGDDEGSVYSTRLVDSAAAESDAVPRAP